MFLLLCFLAGFAVGTGFTQVNGKNIHDGGFHDRGDFKIGHRVFHPFQENGEGAFQVARLDELIAGGAFLDGCFLVNGDEVGFHLIPTIAGLVIKDIAPSGGRHHADDPEQP